MTWDYPDAQHASAKFAVNAVNAQVAIELRDHSWHVSFTVEGAANDVAYAALSIFDRVFDAVLEFLAVREPQTILFTTDREDLAGLYQTYLQKESKRFSDAGYRVDGQHRVLRRFKPSRWSTVVEAQ